MAMIGHKTRSTPRGLSVSSFHEGFDPVEADEARRTKLDHSLNKGQVDCVAGTMLFLMIRKPGLWPSHWELATWEPPVSY